MMRKPPPDPRWARVLARDASADGSFVYAVRSTGVYCRPSCAARRPKPENVSFHADGAAALAAGFRPCRRCRPDQPLADGAAVIAAACRALHSAPSDALPPVAALAWRAGMAPARFRRSFQALTGLTPRAYAAGVRAERLRQALPGSPSVTEALYRAGFNSSGRLYAAADRALGMKPARFRAGGERLRIRFGARRTWLGWVLAAESERGVCAILLGDDPEALERELRQQFPRAEVQPGGAGFARRLAQVVALVEHPRAGHRLPLELQGTAFQRRVWQALGRTRPGERLSYGALARRLGLPRGARAVAAACAANPLAVAVPCHRAVRADGALAGYRWGQPRKRALLAREEQA